VAGTRSPESDLTAPAYHNRLDAAPRTVEFKSAIASTLRSKVWPLIEAGKFKPVIFRTFALAQAADAHALMESDVHIGKIILDLA